MARAVLGPPHNLNPASKATVHDRTKERTLPQTGLDNKIAVLGYLSLCLSVFFFSSLIAADPGAFHALTLEDSWVESLTAVWFLLAGFLLFVTAWMERGFSRRCVYILGGMAMLFVAGEEISWGQRIFGFETPDFLMTLNQQEEITVHNFANGTFDIIYLNGALLLCMATCAAFFCRKDRLLGIPLPSILLMMGLLLLISYEGAGIRVELGMSFREYIMGIRRSFGFVLVEEKGLLLLFLIFSLISRQAKLVIASVATITLILALTFVNWYNVNYHNASIAGLFEVREYLFAIGCLFYSLELLLAQGRLAAISQTPFNGMKLPGGRIIPFWLITCSLVIAGSIALIFFVYLNARLT